MGSSDSSDFATAVVAVLLRLGEGEVVSYGDVAAEAGRPGAARAVGNLLRTSDRPLPWWRVVAASGRLAPGKEREQAQRLRAEGVRVRGGRVVADAAPPPPAPGGAVACESLPTGPRRP